MNWKLSNDASLSVLTYITICILRTLKFFFESKRTLKLLPILLLYKMTMKSSQKKKKKKRLWNNLRINLRVLSITLAKKSKTKSKWPLPLPHSHLTHFKILFIYLSLFNEFILHFSSFSKKKKKNLHFSGGYSNLYHNYN